MKLDTERVRQPNVSNGVRFTYFLTAVAAVPSSAVAARNSYCDCDECAKVYPCAHNALVKSLLRPCASGASRSFDSQFSSNRS